MTAIVRRQLFTQGANGVKLSREPEYIGPFPTRAAADMWANGQLVRDLTRGVKDASYDTLDLFEPPVVPS